MGSIYLQPDDYAEFGAPANVTIAQVRAASQLIDGYLQRPEGLIFDVDSNGNPCNYVSPKPKITLTSGADIIGGSSTSVTIQYSGTSLDNNSVGEAVVLDRGTPALVEVCVVQAIAPAVGASPQTITLQSINGLGPLRSHASGCKIDFGMTIMEESGLPDNRSIARLSRPNPVSLLSGAGRYGYGRQNQQVSGDFQEFNLLAAVSSFGGPPLWIPWAVVNASLSRTTGEVWIPAGILLAYFTDVRIWYLAGYTVANLPDNVKLACASIINNSKETGLGANIRSRTMSGQMTVTKWENTMIDKNTRNILAPYKSRTFN